GGATASWPPRRASIAAATSQIWMMTSVPMRTQIAVKSPIPWRGVSIGSDLPARRDDVVPGEPDPDPRQRPRRRSPLRRPGGLVEPTVVARAQEARAGGPVDDGAREVGADLRIGVESAVRRAEQDARVLVRGVPEQDGAPRRDARGPGDRHDGSVAPAL